MKRFLVFLIVLMLAFFGCKDNSKKSDGQTVKSHVFGFTAADQTNPFFVVLRDRVKQAVEAKGDRLIDIDGKMDQIVQNNAIEDMITQGIEVLMIQPRDSQGIQPALEACRAAGIKVVVIDTGVDRMDLIDAFVASDNYQAGELAGKEVLRLFPDGAQIGLFEAPLLESIRQRVAGFEDVLAGSGCKVVDRKALQTMDQVMSATEDMIQAHPEMNVFFALNDPVAMIALGVFESAGIADKIKIFSVDGSPTTKKSISEGGVYSTSAQSPLGIADGVVDVTYKIINGEPFDAVVPIETYIVNQDNIAAYSADQWQ
ncbi:MAG: substrate-binding domain-containing protein [Treponema sp.]|jgi:ribose transport system substrate-binding protein|nr:substrate-binding domain-containing protein [Treponema sp.]